MASLYDSFISNEDLLKQKNLRHRKINLDYEYISGFPTNDLNLFKAINWVSVDFERSLINAIPNTSGVYVFNFDPCQFSLSNFQSKIPLYIGQASNLRSRLSGYFNYINSKLPADQDKRFMILFFSHYLKVSYYEAPSLTQIQLDELEYTLIDSLIPPFNLKFRSHLAQAYRRSLN